MIIPQNDLSASNTVISSEKCILCTRQRYQFEHGHISMFCSKGCSREWARQVSSYPASLVCIYEPCIWPRYIEISSGLLRPYCSRSCYVKDRASSTQPKLYLLDEKETDFITVYDAFQHQMKEICQQVYYYRILMPYAVTERFLTYVKNKSKEMTCQLRFHGTKQQSHDLKNLQPCQQKDCCLCGILSYGFLLSRTKSGKYKTAK
jgi:hypothetical protein